MKAKNCLIFGGSGQIGRNLIRKLTKKNYQVTVVTRNIHQKSYIIKTQANAGYIDIVESNIFDEQKIRKLFKNADACINLIGILFESKKGNTFKNIHTIFPSLLSKLSKEYKLKHFIHLSAKIKTRAATSNKNFENTIEENNAKSKRGRKSKFKSLIIEKDFEPENPKQLEELDENSCKWPIGHPDEKSFYFCGRSSLKDFSYCKLHLLYAYQPKGKKEEVTEKEEIPEFIEKKIQSA